MKQHKTAKSEATYARVLDTAVRLFAEKGYERTTMRDLSKAAGLGLGALYYYFSSKEQLVQAFYEDLNERVLTGWSPEDGLAALLHRKLDLLQPYRPLLRVLLKEAVDPQSPLCPLHPETRTTRDLSLEAFEGLAPGNGPLLWLAHLLLLAFWLHDGSGEQQATRRLIALAAPAADLLPLLPKSGPFREILDSLFQAPKVK
jgi:AcrR family transcriptional regulator